MKRTIIFTWLLLLVSALLLVTCNRTKDSTTITEPAFHPDISAFTGGVVSSGSVITIELANDYDGLFEVMTPVNAKLFEFSPSIKGTAYWVNAKTIQFRPKQRLPNGQVYAARFYVSKVREVSRDLAVFDFSFQVIAQSFVVETQGMEAINPDDGRWNTYHGYIATSDYMDASTVSRILKAYQGTRSLPVRWEQNAQATRHAFTIDSLQRQQNHEHLRIVWDGKPAALSIKDERSVVIPAMGDFSVMDVRVIEQPEQHVLIHFSDPLTNDQHLQGLVTLDGSHNPRYRVEGNRMYLYPTGRLVGDFTLTIHEGLQSRLGYRFLQRKTFDLIFEDIKPAVRLVGRGVILPDSDGLIFPFEAVNLRAVELRVIKIFESNVGQFLQVNALDGDYELKRAGRLILRRTIELTADRALDYGRWNGFSFDLSKLISAEPGAMYRVELGFRREHARYPCGDEEDMEEVMHLTRFSDGTEDTMDYWDNPEMYWDPSISYAWYDSGYVWEERDNPCHDAYYGRQRSVGRNVLASNLGIIAKGSTGQSMLFAVTDLRTTAPLSNVQLDIYNYQNQLIGTATTGSDGIARISAEVKPYLLIASLDKQRGYLRLDDGSALSLSRFDVGGAEIQKGIKGFIYTDRGVWRPGDSLHVVFMLEDSQKQLPANHPVAFELYNPAGQLVRQQSSTASMNGFYYFGAATSQEAPTGNWRANVRVGGVSFSRVIRIETVKPNRLKIDLDFGTEMLGAHRPDVRGSLHVGWLHGAPARNLRAHVAVTLNQIHTRFPAYTAFAFDDPSKTLTSEEATIFDARIDNEGRADVLPRIAKGQTAPGMLQAHFVVRAFEEGGDYSIDRFSVPYSPYQTYVGIKTPEGEQPMGVLHHDVDHLVEVVTVDSQGRPVSKNRLDVNIYKLEWRWWWDASGENLASYMGSTYPKPVFSQRIATVNGKGSFQFNIPHPEWGRYLIRVSDPDGGHSTGKVIYIDWPGWASRSVSDDPQAAAMLSISTDKETYAVGEQVHVNLPAVKQGRAFVSLESGSRVLESWWQEVSEEGLMFSFPATAAMAPNVYLHLSLIQPHAQVLNDLPVRMYGVVPLFVEDPDTRLSPVIDMADVLLPEQATTIKVKEANGKRMTYTLAIVDEGLLDLTRHLTPDPWNTFYSKEALGVKTWDMYDHVLGAYGGRIEQVFSIGGDEDVVGRLQPQANRFKPMVKFMGPFTLDKRKTNSHTLDMPSYIGSVRVMVVAGDQGAYGHAEQTVAVKKPLMVLATMPRVLSPGEKVTLPVTVFAMDESVKDVTIEVNANELFKMPGGSRRQVRFDQTGDQVVNFELDIVDATGVGKLKVDVSAGREKASYEIEIAIRNPNQRIGSVIAGMVEAGDDWQSYYVPVGITGTNAAILELSAMPPIDFGRRLKYLVSYPHGCLEQVTSSAFPQLFIGSVMEMDDNMRRHTESNIKEAIRIIASYQRPDGGLRYWPGGADVSDWGTSYAGHFMLEAASQGYALPVRFKDSWIVYQRTQARSYTSEQPDTRFGAHRQDDLIQSYRLYTLALANAPELGAMNRLRESSNLSLQARWRLAAAYSLAGQPEAARKLTEGIAWQVADYSAFNATFGSPERDMAMILETLSLMGKREEAIPIIKKISEALTSQKWMSTQTTAYCLLAMSKYVGIAGDGGGVQAAYSINGQPEVSVSSNAFIGQADLADYADAEVTVKVSNKDNNMLFVRLIADGIPGIGAVSVSENQLRLSVNFRHMNGEPLQVDRLAQGTDFIAEVMINNPGNLGGYTDMVLTQIVAPGWEIRNVRMDEVIASNRGNTPVYQDFRDDRVHTHFDLDVGQTKQFVVVLHAAYLGRYYLPGTFCEAMYNKDVYARLPGQWVEVVMPGEGF